MNKYSILFWYTVEYRRLQITLLAKNEESIREYLEKDTEYPRQFRIRDGVDTLEFVVLEENIQLPYKLVE